MSARTDDELDGLPRTFRGLDPQAVHEWADQRERRHAAELAARDGRIHDLTVSRDEAEQARQQAECQLAKWKSKPWKGVGDAAQEYFDQAQAKADELDRKARAQAQRLVSAAQGTARAATERAEKDARTLLEKARAQADGILHDARQQAAETISTTNARIREAQSRLQEAERRTDQARTEAERRVAAAEAECQRIIRSLRDTADGLQASVPAGLERLVPEPTEDRTTDAVPDPDDATEGQDTGEPPSLPLTTPIPEPERTGR